MEYGAALVAAVGRIRAVHLALLADVNRCHQAIVDMLPAVPWTPDQRRDVEFWLRAYVRAFGALVDGAAHSFRQVVLEFHDAGFIRLTPGEHAILSEISYRFDDGRIRTTPNYLRTLEGLEASCLYFARAFSVDFRLAKSDHRFDSFRKALTTRHTVTHPKALEDLIAPTKALDDLGPAIQWFTEEIVRLLRLTFAKYLPEQSDQR